MGVDDAHPTYSEILMKFLDVNFLGRKPRPATILQIRYVQINVKQQVRVWTEDWAADWRPLADVLLSEVNEEIQVGWGRDQIIKSQLSRKMR